MRARSELHVLTNAPAVNGAGPAFVLRRGERVARGASAGTRGGLRVEDEVPADASLDERDALRCSLTKPAFRARLMSDHRQGIGRELLARERARSETVRLAA